MIVILLNVMIKPSIVYGRTNIYERINDYIKSLSHWNKLVHTIPYKIYVFENSGYGMFYELDPKITYISESVMDDHIMGKSKSLSMVIKRFIEILNLSDDDKILLINGRYAPVEPLTELFELVENNDIVISSNYIEYGGVNTRWHATTVKIMKDFIDACIEHCYDSSTFYEVIFKSILDKYNDNVYYYSKPIKIIPTYEGGMNVYREFI
jgi:hypothetical protein